MITNFSLNDNTQEEILEHLKITSHLLSRVGTKLSDKPKESQIYVMPDLGIAQNSTRMLGGFYTGACYTWDSDIPFVPVDATVNVCGTLVYRLKRRISPKEFNQKLDDIMKTRETYLQYVRTRLPSQILNSIDVNDESKFFWNYNVGNHFAILAEQNEGNSEISAGQYMIVHASAIELKKDNLEYGLYPVPGNWYYNDIQTEYDEKSNRYLRYISGEKAVKFYKLAQLLQIINKDRNRYFCKKVLGNLADKEIINMSHYGMPTNNAVCIGCQWEQEDFTLLTAPGNDIFLIHPNIDSNNTIQLNDKSITLTPHGCGVRLNKNTESINYCKDGITIGDRYFRNGKSLDIGKDVSVRTSNMSSEQLKEYIESILRKCPGKIYGQMHQLFARTKHGDFYYSKREKDIEER